MPLIVIDLMGDEEDQITKKAPLVKEEPLEDKNKRLRKQVVNINGDIVEI